jgi:hypothetical protein
MLSKIPWNNIQLSRGFVKHKSTKKYRSFPEKQRKNGYIA